MTVDKNWLQRLQPRVLKPRRNIKVVYTPYDRPWTWKPLQRAYRQKYMQKVQQTRMAEMKRSEAILRNLASELLTEQGCQHFKQALHHFRVSHSVTSLCQQLKSVIDNTEKLLLLVELSTRLPRHLQDDFHRLCSLQYSHYDTYLKVFTSGNASHEIPRAVAQDPTGRYKMVSRGSEKKIYMKYNSAKHAYEVYSLPGTSVTSGVYSQADADESDDDLKDEGYVTPTHLKGKNVRRVFLKRHSDGSLGLGIIGGKEFGKQITINVVEEGGPAAAEGLQVGDKIVEVNGHSFLEFTHAEAVTVMRNAWNLIMMVEGPAPTEKTFDWPVQAPYGRLEDVEIVVQPDSQGKMGCSTQRLRNKNLIVKDVEDHSPSKKAGLRVRDQITKMDNIRVGDLSEKQILMLTRAKHLVLLVRREATDKAQGKSDNPYINPVHGTVSSSNSGGIPPEKQRRFHSVDGLESGRRRNFSAESRHTHKDKENVQPRSPQTPVSVRQHLIKSADHPIQHTIRSSKDSNWVLSPKPREHRYTQRKDTNSRDYSQYPMHARTFSEGQYELKKGYALRDGLIQNGGVSRYVRNKSSSNNRSTISVKQIQNEDKIIHAIQHGLEKRQRAIRLSLYQMTDPADYEWEI